MQGGNGVARRSGHPIGRRTNLHLHGSGGHWYRRGWANGYPRPFNYAAGFVIADQINGNVELV
jgi:hypothetical protein